MPEPLLLKYEDVAALLNVTVRQTRDLVASKRLRCVPLGHRTIRFRRRDVDAYISRRAGDPAPLR